MRFKVRQCWKLGMSHSDIFLCGHSHDAMCWPLDCSLLLKRAGELTYILPVCKTTFEKVKKYIIRLWVGQDLNVTKNCEKGEKFLGPWRYNSCWQNMNLRGRHKRPFPCSLQQPLTPIFLPRKVISRSHTCSFYRHCCFVCGRLCCQCLRQFFFFGGQLLPLNRYL